MPAPTKADWMQRLADAGVHAPSSWTITQLKAHWEEIQEQAVSSGQMSLRKHMQDLKRASKKKGDLMAFLQKEGVEVNVNQTIATMFRVGEKTITEKYEPEGNELVGFGENANMSYLDLKVHRPQYAQWVLTTDQESEESHWKLRRLARWLRDNEKVTLPPRQASSLLASRSPPRRDQVPASPWSPVPR